MDAQGGDVMTSAPLPVLTPLKRLLVSLVLAVLYGLLARSSIAFSRSEGQVAAIWLADAALVSIALIWRLSFLGVMLPALAAHFISLLLIGNSMPNAFGLAVANGIEIITVLTLTRRSMTTADQIKDPHCLARFLGIAILAAGCSGLIAALTIAGTSPAFPSVLWQWWLAHAMAMMTIVPILLVIEADRQDCRRREAPLLPPQTWPDIAIGAVAIAAIFTQSSFPFLFLAVPVILAVAARRGSAASAVLLLATTAIAAWYTLDGHGPVNLVKGDVHLKAAVLQIFIFATFASTLPVTLANERVETMRERTLTLIATMNELPFSVDLKGRWTYLSSHWGKLFGTSGPLPLGRRALALVPPERRRTLLNAISSLLSGDVEEANFDFEPNIASPVPIHVRARLRLTRKRDGSPDGFVGIISDMSRETERERALAVSERRLLSLAENAPVGIFEFDNDGNAIFLNREWARMHGMSIEEGLGKGWQRILDAEQMSRYTSSAPDRKSGATTDLEAVVQRPDGTQGHIRVVTTALRDADGAITGRMGVVVDQTLEHEAKAALMAALDEAKSAVSAKDRFLALMSHELRTPMNGVLGFAERLQETELTDPQRRYVSLITRSGGIMLALLNDILDTSRIREGQMQIAREPYDLAATLSGTCQHFEPLATQRGLQLRMTFASPLPRTVVGDRQRLTQILNNLMGNALKFTEEGWIAVYARIEMQYERTILILEVTDTGIGIAPELAERVFDAFDQGAEDISMRFGGTGLGLPIARGLAEQMGGSLNLVTSSRGKGSIFRLTLPLELPVEKAGARSAPQEGSVAPARRAVVRRLKVLVAEDNEINRELMSDLLADCGCDLTMVVDGAQAVEAVARAADAGKPFDLVFMDLRMPELDGIGATRAIRERGIDGATLPIIAVTASVHQDAMDACWQAGMQDYVSKPVTRGAIELVFDQWGVPGRAAAPKAEAPLALDPELAPLLSRFIAQCDDCLASVTMALAQWPETGPAELAAAQNMAHSLAGLAATFAAPQLVAPAQALDLALDKKAPSAAMRRVLLDMQYALELYLAEAAAGAS
jgi:PAS domain S-box-containing protein